MSDLTSKNGISADGGGVRGLDFGGKDRKSNVKKAKEITYPALPDAGEHSLADTQESGPNSPGRMPRQVRGGGT